MIHSNRFACTGFVWTCTRDSTPLADESLGYDRVADQSPSEWNKLHQPVRCIPRFGASSCVPASEVYYSQLATRCGVRSLTSLRCWSCSGHRTDIGRKACYAKTRLRSRYSNATIGVNLLSRPRLKLCFIRTYAACISNTVLATHPLRHCFFFVGKLLRVHNMYAFTLSPQLHLHF